MNKSTIKNTFTRSFLREGQTLHYFTVAIAVIIVLFLISKTAPTFPAPMLIVVLLAYAALSTIGALHFTVINRLHKQMKLNKEGRLSRITRKWTLTFIAIFILSLISACLFVLESPKWNILEWFLVCFAIPLYYVVYLVAQQALSKEYAARFDRANAIWLSFILVAIILCALYAILALNFPSQEYTSLTEAFDVAEHPFANSPSALMVDADLIASFTDGFVSYGISKASGESSILALIFQLVIFATVIFGLMNLFSFCLLTKHEISDEFRLLPAIGDTSQNGRIVKRYFVAAAIISLVFVIGFLTLDSEAEKLKPTEEQGMIESILNEGRDRLIFIYDGGLAKSQMVKEIANAYEPKYKELEKDCEETLTPLIISYYSTCRSNVDSYLNSREGVFGWLDGIWNFFVPDNLKNKFIEEITNGANGSVIEQESKEYQDKIDQLNEEFFTELQAKNSTKPANEQLSQDELDRCRNFYFNTANLNLWSNLDDLQESSPDYYNALFGANSSFDREFARQAAEAVIDESENAVFAQLDKIQSEDPQTQAQ